MIGLSNLFLISSISPWIFGFTAFVIDYSQGRSKLDPKAHKCVLLGYSLTKKAIGVFIQQQESFMCPWMSLSLNNNYITPRLFFKGRIRLMKNSFAMCYLWWNPLTTHFRVCWKWRMLLEFLKRGSNRGRYYFSLMRYLSKLRKKQNNSNFTLEGIKRPFIKCIVKILHFRNS